MAGKKLALDFIFSQTDERNFLYYFDCLCQHLITAAVADKCQNGTDCSCQDINRLITFITERLVDRVSGDHFKYEQLLFTIPWNRFLHRETETRLKPETFAHFLSEYVQIFPNRSEKFLLGMVFILRGDPARDSDTTITETERSLFDSIRDTIAHLVQSVNNFEYLFVKLIKKRYPFLHNANAHEFVCYSFNIINCGDKLSPESNYELFNFLFTKLLEIDLEDVFNEYGHLNKENLEESGMFGMDMEKNCDASAKMQEQLKKITVLDAIVENLFRYIDEKQRDESATPATELSLAVQIIARISLQLIPPSKAIHCQYFVFYLCSQSTQFFDIFVNDLWRLSIDPDCSVVISESCFNLLLTLFIKARFAGIDRIFLLLKIILQWLDSHLSAKSGSKAQNAATKNDLMYYNFCIGFCRLFCMFHHELQRNQIDCLKNMDLKRTLLSSHYKPLQYAEVDLCEQFVHLASFYRIGYANLAEIEMRNLKHTFPEHNEKTCNFGTKIHLKSVKNRIEPLMRPPINDAVAADPGRKRPAVVESRPKGFLAATSPGTTTTSDDGMTSPGTPLSSSFIMSHMLSDYEMMD